MPHSGVFAPHFAPQFSGNWRAVSRPCFRTQFDLDAFPQFGAGLGVQRVHIGAAGVSRIAACVNVDAPGFSADELQGLKQPLLWFRLEKAGAVPGEFLKTMAAPVYELQLAGTKHRSVEDWDYLEAESLAQRDAAAGRLRLIGKHVDAFLGEYLKDQKSDLVVYKASSDTTPDRVYMRYVDASIGTTPATSRQSLISVCN